MTSSANYSWSHAFTVRRSWRHRSRARGTSASCAARTARAKRPASGGLARSFVIAMRARADDRLIATLTPKRDHDRDSVIPRYEILVMRVALGAETNLS